MDDQVERLKKLKAGKERVSSVLMSLFVVQWKFTYVPANSL